MSDEFEKLDFHEWMQLDNTPVHSMFENELDWLEYIWDTSWKVCEERNKDIIDKQAAELAALREWVTDCRDKLLYQLSNEQTELGIIAEGLGQDTTRLLTPNEDATDD